jgi:hypothetical protein
VARLKPAVTVAQVRDEANCVRLELNPKSTDTVSVTGVRPWIALPQAMKAIAHALYAARAGIIGRVDVLP